MDLKIVNTGNTTNISTISTTVSTTTPSNITRTVSFKIIWKELDSPGETTDVLTCFSVRVQIKMSMWKVWVWVEVHVRRYSLAWR